MIARVYNFAKNLLRLPTQTAQINSADKTIWYGTDNNFPLKLATLVQESPAASSCVSIIGDFIEGDGFSDGELKNKIVNGQNQRFGDLHSQVCESMAMFEGFALCVKYTRSYAISEIFLVPFENVRLNKPDEKGNISKITVNPYFGTSLFRYQDNSEYDVFNSDPAVVQSQMEKQGTKYKGQILYVGGTRPLSRFYPQPFYFSAQYWMNVDARIGQFHANNLEDGFFQSVLMKLVGDNNQMSTHPDDMKMSDAGVMESFRTVAERLDIEMQKFQGSDSRNKIFILWAAMKDQLPELQPFPVTTNEALFNTLQNLTTKNITIATKVPAVLANIQEANNFSGESIRPAVKLMQQRTVKQRALLERTYTDLLSLFKVPYTQPVNIINHNPFPESEAIEPLVWAALTIEEQRQWIKDNTDYPITENAAPPAPAPQPIQNFKNVLLTDYPDEAKSNAKKALKFMNEVKSCGGPAGRRMTQDIIDSKPLSLATVRRIYNYLNRNRQHENKLFSDSCESVLFHAWGGMPMFEWCSKTIKHYND